MKIDPYIVSDGIVVHCTFQRCIDCVDIASRFSARGRQTTLRWQKQIFAHTRLSHAYLALARLSCIFDKHFTYRSHHFLSPMLLSPVNSAVSNSYLDCKTVSTAVASIIHPKLDYCNSVIQSS